MAQSLGQGREFASFHTNQHGGAMVPLGGAPVDHSSVLPDEMRASAGVSQADGFFKAVGGMSDAVAHAAPAQKGGRRSRKGKSRSRKGKSRSRSRKGKSRKGKKQSGGSHSGAPVTQSWNLLDSSQYGKAGTADFSNPLLLK